MFVLVTCYLLLAPDSYKRHADLKQPFHLGDAALVHQEQDDVILRLYDRVVMGDQHRIAAHYGADGGPGGQFDVFDGAPDHL